MRLAIAAHFHLPDEMNEGAFSTVARTHHRIRDVMIRLDNAKMYVGKA